MKYVLIALCAIILIVWLIPNSIRVYKIGYIQRCIVKNYYLSQQLLLNNGFTQVPTAVMRMPGCAEVVYNKDGDLQHNYLVCMKAIPYSVALNLLYKDFKKNFAKQRNDR